MSAGEEVFDPGRGALSVIVPTYNRAASLRRLLDSIEAQGWPAARTEVVVVDDGSSDGTPEVLAAPRPFTLRPLHQANQGAALARNRGAAHAAGDLLVFLDDDIVLAPGFLGGIAILHARHGRAIGMGAFDPYLPTAFARVQSRDEGAMRPLPSPGAAEQEVGYTSCVTNNLSLLAPAFREIGGMRDITGDGSVTWGDVEFGYRARDLGYRFWRSIEARCEHRDYAAQDLETAARRMYHVGRLAPRLFDACPGVEADLPMFRDMRPARPGREPLRLSLRKWARALLSSGAAQALLSALVDVLRRHDEESPRLAPLYRWILGGQLYQGLRAGLRGTGA